ncbi:MAG TPA: sugar transferase [Actinomycetota bacterium]|jgi:lipopolysaccharide/colanic/teichoic acid biosynthesis glycosyltransferase|nr:sugar transferase [Actinomycetota bacterium]
MPDAKRVLDLVVGVPALVLSLPVQAVVALAVRARLGTPVLFRQKRPGLHGIPFEMVKFRTMVDPDPARGLVTDDERMTPLGTFLRSTSLDELPALLHVVRGQMSLVGPRPLLVRYLDRYSPEQARRHEVRPGLTGLAQVEGRNATTWKRRLALDVEYVDTRSITLDLRLLGRTVKAVITRKGVSGEGTSTMNEFMGTSGGVEA